MKEFVIKFRQTVEEFYGIEHEDSTLSGEYFTNVPPDELKSRRNGAYEYIV